jgi:hypothetical protein
MQRRSFLKGAAAVALAAPVIYTACEKENQIVDDKDFVGMLVKQNDKQIPDMLARQEQNSSHRWFGGVKDAWGIHTPNGTSHFVRTLVCAILSPTSKYADSEELLQKIHDATTYLQHAQHDDGTIDLLSTNFHSTPDTAFVMEWVCGSYGLLNNAESNKFDDLLSHMRGFLLPAGEALSIGGIHTPNHRWVVSMALARLNSLLPDKKYVKRIDEWLAEHIDIDEDGQYTEKSSSIYSPLTDRCLITVARLLDRPELYDPVRKNLDMTLYYIHPNGEVATEASKRQDKYKFGHMSPYYYPYRYMALLDGNGRFAAMASWIAQTSFSRLHSMLMFFKESPKLASALSEKKELPQQYNKFFPGSNIARIRRGPVSATILAKNYTIFSFRKGNAVLQSLRVASSFFGKGQFEGEELKLEEGVYCMKQKLDGPYYQLFPQDRIPEDGDWEKMKRDERPKSEVQELEYSVRISEDSGEFDIEIQIQGTDNVPVTLECAFKHGGVLKGVEKIKEIKDAWFLKSGIGSYSFKGQVVEFGPGQHQHQWTQLRGAEKKLDAQCVYLTGFTPINWSLHIG